MTSRRLILSLGATFVRVVAVPGLILAVASVGSCSQSSRCFRPPLQWRCGPPGSTRPTWRAPPTSGRTKTPRVLPSNLRYGRVDPVSFVALAKSSAGDDHLGRVDVEAVSSSTGRGIAESFPGLHPGHEPIP